MGRKPAPQPLALSESALPASDRRLPETLKIVSPDSPLTSTTRSPASPPATSPYHYADSNGQAQPQQAPTQSSRSAQQPQSQPSIQAQTQAQAPAQGQRFHQPLHVADLVQQPLEDVDSPGFPPSPNTVHSTTYSHGQQQQQQYQQQQQQYSQQAYQKQQQQQQQSQKPQHKQLGHGRRQNEDKASKSNFFFHFGKSSSAAKPSEKTASTPADSNPRFDDPRDESTQRGYNPPSAKQNHRPQESSYADHNAQQKAAASNNATFPSRSEASFASTSGADSSSIAPAGKKVKQKTFARLGRSRSIRDDNNGTPHPLNSNTNTSTDIGLPHSAVSSPGLPEPAPMRVVEQPDRVHQPVGSLKTAPIIQHDRSFRDMMASSARNHSADRAHSRDVPGLRGDGHQHNQHNQHHYPQPRAEHRNDRDQRLQPPSLRDPGSGSAFFSGLKNSSRSAADMISKGLFGKNTRSGSTTEREHVIDDEHYVLKVINQPLLEQTRLTRISKRLEDSRDRTEFWMPAFPWRAIDYLNYKGTDVEGLYRVPGSGPQIKKWQRKFDEEYDVDLFAQEDLYDINIIGSMLKAWLRELPDELFPKEAQERIARECAGAETVPQMLVDELSNLPPFNYYLLFAITCHLSLLLAHSDKNKMDFRNLCICFQPCMKIDAFSFKFLVCDWRDCWKGCLNEPRYIEEEYRRIAAPPPRGISTLRPDEEEEVFEIERSVPNVLASGGGNGTSSVAGSGSGSGTAAGTGSNYDERNVSSADSGKQLNSSANNDVNNGNSSGDHQRNLKKKPMAVETGSVASNETLSTTLTVDSQRLTTPPRQSGDLRPLSPIKPLSPLGF